METESKPHISPSQLGTLASCGMRYYYRYIERLKRAPGIALILGSGVHAGVAVNMRRKRDTTELAPLAEVNEFTVNEIENRIKNEEVTLDNIEKELGLSKVVGAAKDKAVILSGLHYRELAPMIEPVHVERELMVTLEGYPYDLKGILDIEETLAVRDTKTSGKSPSQQSADTSLQLTFYHMAKYVHDKSDCDLFLDYLVSTKEPKAVTQSTTRNYMDYASLLLRIETLAKVRETGAFFPAPPDWWGCSAKWCGYWFDCPYGARGRSRAA